MIRGLRLLICLALFLANAELDNVTYGLQKINDVASSVLNLYMRWFFIVMVVTIVDIAVVIFLLDNMANAGMVPFPQLVFEGEIDSDVEEDDLSPLITESEGDDDEDTTSSSSSENVSYVGFDNLSSADSLPDYLVSDLSDEDS